MNTNLNEVTFINSHKNKNNMEVIIKLDKTTPKAQFALLVNALLAIAALQGDDEVTAAGTTAAPVVSLAPPAKPRKEKPVSAKEIAAAVEAEADGAAEKTYSDEEVRAKCAELKAAGKMGKVKDLIIAHNAQSATAVTDRATFMKELNAL